jgi:hypothetical protein
MAVGKQSQGAKSIGSCLSWPHHRNSPDKEWVADEGSAQLQQSMRGGIWRSGLPNREVATRMTSTQRTRETETEIEIEIEIETETETEGDRETEGERKDSTQQEKKYKNMLELSGRAATSLPGKRTWKAGRTTLDGGPRFAVDALDGQLQRIPGLDSVILGDVIHSCQTPQLRQNAALHHGHRYRANGELKFSR